MKVKWRLSSLRLLTFDQQLVPHVTVLQLTQHCHPGQRILFLTYKRSTYEKQEKREEEEKGKEEK